MNVARPCAWILLLFTPGSLSFAVDILVPTQQPTIQAAIVASSDGDVIRVGPGTYLENLDFLGKAVTLLSNEGPEVTIIDAGGSGSVVRFASGEGLSSIIDGFTLTGGSGSTEGGVPDIHFGGGVYCNATSPTIRNCIICNNTIPPGSLNLTGGGIYMFGGAPEITGNVICNNTGTLGVGVAISVGATPLVADNVIVDNFANFGAGIGSYLSSPTIRDNYIAGNFSEVGGAGIGMVEVKSGATPWIESNVITGNVVDPANVEQGYGGGVHVEGVGSTFTPVFRNNVITGNEARLGGGMAFQSSVAATLTNNVIHGNSALENGGGLAFLGSATAILTNSVVRANTAVGPDAQIDAIPTAIVVSFSNVEGGWAGPGNIDALPLFAAPDLGDFHLLPDSPCRNAGTETAPELPDLDYEGDPRIVDVAPDMGADEFDCVGAGCVAFRRGDVDGAGPIALIDGITILNFIFVPGTPTPPCLDALDTDDSGGVGLPDPILLLNYIFIPGSSTPAAPFPACGLDPSDDALSCVSYTACP